MSNPLLDMIAGAAARGVEVTVITNHREPCPLTLKWATWETRDSGWAAYRGAGYVLRVRDCDGEFSDWSLKRHGKVIAEGQTSGSTPYYHCDAACLAAEAALRAEVRPRLAALRAKGGAR